MLQFISTTILTKYCQKITFLSAQFTVLPAARMLQSFSSLFFAAKCKGVWPCKMTGKLWRNWMISWYSHTITCNEIWHVIEKINGGLFWYSYFLQYGCNIYPVNACTLNFSLKPGRRLRMKWSLVNSLTLTWVVHALEMHTVDWNFYISHHRFLEQRHRPEGNEFWASLHSWYRQRCTLHPHLPFTSMHCKRA